MVKLQKQVAYKYKEKMHYKHLIVIPEETLEKVGWSPGEDLTLTISGNSLILKSTTTATAKNQTTSRGGA